MSSSICSWCKIPLPDVPGPADKISHGCCETCLEKQLAEAKKTPPDPGSGGGKAPSAGSGRTGAALAAAIASPPSRSDEWIPAGYRCTNCAAGNEHAPGCRPPRGLRKA